MDGLLEGKYSFNEAEKISDDCKSLNAAKDAFVRELGLSSWTEGDTFLSKFSQKSELSKFKVKKGKAKNFVVRVIIIIHIHASSN